MRLALILTMIAGIVEAASVDPRIKCLRDRHHTVTHNRSASEKNLGGLNHHFNVSSCRQETRGALFFLWGLGVLYTIPAHMLSLHTIACVFFTFALLWLGNYSAHIHQAHIFMSFMRNYCDKTR